jgi:methionine sulfoxide reductase heme-binding subunit
VTYSHVAWYTARASGYTAFVLLTLSIAIGLVLSLKVHSPRWPRFVTEELHRFATVTALVLVVIHLTALLLDPFMQFSAMDLIVPFTGSYRPAGVALGITALYLLLAIWLSSKLRKRIGWRTWRLLHYASFAVYLAVVGHTILAGEDARTWWGEAIDVASVLVVGSLAIARFAGGRFSSDSSRRSHRRPSADAQTRSL